MLPLRLCQEEAISCAKGRLTENETNLSLCTGAGKTRIISACSRLRSRSILVFPSLLLLKQYYNDTMTIYVNIPIYYAATDGTLTEISRLSDGMDELDSAEWCIFTTYISAPAIYAKLTPEVLPHLIIHDEAHHIVSPIYAEALSHVSSSVHRMNLSATLPDSKMPHYKYPLLKGIRDGVVRDFNMDLFLCVDKERGAGGTALLELIVHKLLTQHPTVKLLLYMREANTDGDSSSSVHTFLRDHATSLRAHGWWVEGINETTSDRDKLLRGFEKNTCPVSILVSCRTLSEGIDLKGANCMLPWDPTASIVDNIQRIGRVLRLYKGKPLKEQLPSTVVIPVFLPEADYLACGGDSAAIHTLLEKQIEDGERGNFRPIVNVCTALKSELAAEDAELFNALLNYPRKPKVTVDRGLVDCVAKACKKKADDIMEELVDVLGDVIHEGEWDEDDAGEVVAALADTQGITLVIRDGEEAEIYGNGSQAVTVEKKSDTAYKVVKGGTKKAAGDMEAARKRVAHRMRVNFSDECQILLGLDTVEGADAMGGLVLSRLTAEVKIDEDWEARRQLWIYQYQKFGRNPSKRSTDPDEKRAGHWHCGQRKDYKKKEKRMTPERIAILNATPGWSWDEDDIWEPNRQRWIQQYQKIGRAPSSISKDSTEKRAGKWQSDQRLHYKKQSNRMTPERIAILNATPGWTWEEDMWEPARQLWIQQYQTLGKTPSQIGTTQEEKKAGRWQTKQRIAYRNKSSCLTPERIAILNTTPGWKWGNEDTWESDRQRWIAICEKKLGRNPSNSSKDEEERTAGQWQGHQRDKYKKGLLTPERIAALNATPGWTWSANEEPITPPTTPDVIEHVPPVHAPRVRPKPKSAKETPDQKTARQRSALEEYHKRFKSMNADTYKTKIIPADFTAYHDVADAYDTRDPPERQPLTKIAALLTRYNRASYSAIDLGCGRNRLRTLDAVSKMSWTSVDVHAADDTVTVADMGALPYEEETFDFAILGRSLWARNHEDVLRETLRILKVGGSAVICESFRRWLNAENQNTLLKSLRDIGFEIQYEEGTKESDEIADVFQYIVARKP
jgi:hypothetical protein